MPKYSRHFPVSQHINQDHEVWEMTDRIGDRSLRIWLEFLAIGERNEGVLPSWSDSYAKAIAFKCHTNAIKVRLVCDHGRIKGWLVCDTCPTLTAHPCDHPLRIAKFWNYHKRRETKESRSGDKRAPSDLTNLTNHTDQTNGSAHVARKTQLPHDWKIPENASELAAHNGWPLPSSEFEAFRDYHLARGSVFKDWDRAFYSWLRNAKQFKRNGVARQEEGQLSDRTLRILKRGLE